MFKIVNREKIDLEINFDAIEMIRDENTSQVVSIMMLCTSAKMTTLHVMLWLRITSDSINVSYGHNRTCHMMFIKMWIRSLQK